ncbi:hypothetical protein SAMN05421821_10156 [Mucilaginibacter lappiensis]|uniref:Uncharacterized protein n=1 Tax=Mucilaginibacter lappiensis TaxID=354630 RepID=A0ABR6PIH3_9SPHI|nr:hypothetical protein [Mucilaginibacter lappiensis]SIP89086.1 hypothetical protein SAMN05421821_10156 [Mucilaginibacter lappiensis]
MKGRPSEFLVQSLKFNSIRSHSFWSSFFLNNAVAGKDILKSYFILFYDGLTSKSPIERDGIF